jgi:peptidoglycan hydrolase-like protein with peptidoglycan-binding domain
MNDKEKFIADLYPAAAKISQETGMSKELILAQAAQETGWGEHVLPGTNNIFNVKASADWTGPTKTFNVWEIENGKKVWKDQSFRVYGSVEEALRDRVKFLEENPRYAKAGLFDAGTKGNLEKEAAALQKAGYATDPNYAKQLVAVYNGSTMQHAVQHAQEQTRTPGPPVAKTPPSSVSTGHEGGTLKQGVYGTAVHDLQADLAKLGYTGSNGKPLKPDGDFGLDTRHAVERFQHDHHLKVDGIAGPKTLEALDHVQAKNVAPNLADPKNPDHALYEQTLAGVHKLDANLGRTPDQQSDQLAAALVVAAKRESLTKIDNVVLSGDGSHAFAVQGAADSPNRQIAHVQTAQAVNTPIDQSSQALAQLATKPVEPVSAPPLAVQPSQQGATM